MRRVLKILGILAGVVILAALGGFIYIKTAFPKVGPVAENVKIENANDSAVLARGEYLVNHVAGCVDCHTPRDLKTFAIPRIEGKEGMGGMNFSRELGFPGNFYSKNISSDKKTGIGAWSDAQLLHTVTTGVRANGEPLFPVMPYKNYGHADEKDIKAILAYIRTLKPIENAVPESEADFPVSLFMRMEPADAKFVAAPDKSNSVEYGKYLVNLASCSDCHTPRDDKGQYLMDKYLAGGNEFRFPGMGTVTSANITPHPTTGIAAWDKETFIKMFKQYEDNHSWRVPWEQKGYQTVMPWPEFSGMTVEDLGAIYEYLKTVKPVESKITKWKAESEATASR